MNQGIGGNVVTSDGLGPTAMDRYMRDVLNQSGVKYVIVFEGVNDIGAGVSAATITAAFDTLIAQARAQPAHLRRDHHAVRQQFLLQRRARDRPPERQHVHPERQVRRLHRLRRRGPGHVEPARLQTAYDSGDGLHLNPAGYQKLADTVDLALFSAIGARARTFYPGQVVRLASGGIERASRHAGARC